MHTIINTMSHIHIHIHIHIHHIHHIHIHIHHIHRRSILMKGITDFGET